LLLSSHLEIVDSATEPANSFIEVTVTVAIPEPPCMMFRLVGLAVKLKSGLVTVTVIVVDRSVPLVLVPFIIIAVDPTSVPEGTAIVNSQVHRELKLGLQVMLPNCLECSRLLIR